VLPHATAKLGPDRLVATGTLGTVLALALFGLAHDAPTALVASPLAGAAWIVVLSSLNVSAQVALPEWVRARGLATFMTVYFGAQAVRLADRSLRCGVFEDTAEPSRFFETFLVDSWLEHLHQHERGTNADRLLQTQVQHFQLEGTPKVTYMIAAERV
jgi:hypothetical protein